MKTFCPGCGAALPAGARSCRACKTPAVGAKFDDSVLVLQGQEARVPPLCCCCLNALETMRKHDVLAEEKGTARYFVTVEVPWCRACLNRRQRFFLMAGGWVLGGLMLGTASVDLLGGGAGFVLLGAVLGGVAGGAAAWRLLPRLSKAQRKPGHIAACDAFRAASSVGLKVAGRRAVKVGFRNRAFARKWVELNGAPGA